LANKICLLTTEEVALLEKNSVWPQCKNHHHCTRREAEQGVAVDEFRWVGGKDTCVSGFVSMLAPVSHSNGWVPVPCHREDGVLLIGMRTWGNSKRS